MTDDGASRRGIIGAIAAAAAGIFAVHGAEAAYIPPQSASYTPSVASLRVSTTVNLPQSQTYLQGYAAIGDGGDDPFYVGTPTAQNGGTIINDASGRSWYRETGGSPLNLLWFGGSGLSDYTSVFSSAMAVAGQAGIVFVPPGVYSTSAVPTGSSTIIGMGAQFLGAFTAWEPPFGGDFHVINGSSFKNTIVGSTRNLAPAATLAFPTGVTGYGRTDNPGNTCFGLFGRADLYNTGVAQNECDTFNFAAAPTLNFPPNMAIGTPEYVANALVLAAFGNFQAKTGLYVAFGAQKFLAGVYIAGNACSNYGLFIDVVGTVSPLAGALIRTNPVCVPMTLQTIGAMVAENVTFQVLDTNSNIDFAIKQNGRLLFSTLNITSTAAAGSAGPLPAQPLNYLLAEIWNGSAITTVKIPYYL